MVVTKGRERLAMNYPRWAISCLSYLMGCELSKMGSGLGIAAHLAT